MKQLFDITDEIYRAISDGEAVVALESTIITHGMPWPQNYETAASVEQTVRDQGAIPATIAIQNGKIKVGYSDNDLKALAQTQDVLKLSRADLAYALSQKKTGSTTVAATMMAAYRIGIECFATGGIGGVHQGADTTFDISADLEELAQTGVIVVCAGPKAILDIPKTMEVLETNGVPVIGYQTNEIPAFWSTQSGIEAPLRMESAEEIAALWKTRRIMKQEGAVLITNPVPLDKEITADTMRTYIDAGIQAAAKKGITGKAVTPFLLGNIAEQTGGKSLETNIALIKNNAKLAAEIAVELSKDKPLKQAIGFTATNRSQ